MNPSLTKKLIIVGVIILVLLIFFTLLLRGLFQKQQQTNENNLIPTSSFEFGGTAGKNKNSSGQDETSKNPKLLFEGNVNRLQDLAKKLPTSNSNFSLGYSSLLDKFFVSTKTSQGRAAFEQYLTDNGVYDLYKDVPGLFNFTQDPIEKAIKDSEEKAVQQKKEKEQQSGEQTNPDFPTKSFKEFTDIVSNLFSVNIDELNKTVEESNKEIDQAESGSSGGGGGGGTTGGDICANPPSLVSQGSIRLTPQAMAAFQAAQQEAQSHGVTIYVGSSYRDCQEQIAACTRICGNPNGCPGLCAPPGKSCHQYGEAVDVSNWSSVLPYMLHHGWQHPLPDSDAVHFSLIGGQCPSK